MNLKALFILLAVLFLFSCKNNRKEEVKKIDELIIQLQQTENKFKNIDSLALFSVYNKMITDLKDLHLFTDTIESKTLDKINLANKHISTLTAATQYFPIISSELIKSKTQLQNLKQDAESGLIERVKFDIIYEQEQRILINLTHVLDSTYFELNTKLEETKNNYPTVDSIVDYFKQLNADTTVTK